MLPVQRLKGLSSRSILFSAAAPLLCAETDVTLLSEADNLTQPTCGNFSGLCGDKIDPSFEAAKICSAIGWFAPEWEPR